MDIEVLKIVLIGVLMGFLWHIAIHLLVIFKPCVTNLAVTEVLKDPHKYVRYEHMMYFLRNMICFFFVLLLFIAAWRGDIKIIKQKDIVEISVNSDNKKAE